MKALGISIHEMDVIGKASGRYFKFKVHKVDGDKLDYVVAAGALFTLNLVIEGSWVKTTPLHVHELY